MAVHKEQVVEHSGFKKEIDEGAFGMILDNLQVYQYQYPVKSTLRELVSNAIDAIEEKKTALSILSGASQIEDHYALIEDPTSGVYKDSSFDPSYYTPAHLDLNDNTAHIIYEEGGSTQKDVLRIIDKGVGLGGRRLQGYFKLGYSSKRLAKKPLGKFGIGAKAGLSTGVKYYTVINVYNGRRYMFNIYSENAESLIPAFNLETGVANKFELFNAGTTHEYKVYYEDTTETNGVEVRVEFKKHYKQDLIAAVKSQLLYFPNVDFTIKHEDGTETEHHVQAEILYEDDTFIISDNTQFSKPHIIINRVAYGYVDFLELELDQKNGNLGIKVGAEEVDINPSRESVIWNEVTRNTMVTKFKQAGTIATKMIEERLQEKDFLKWIRTCAVTLSVAGSGYKISSDKTLEIIRRLSNVVDVSSFEPTYSVDPSFRYYSTAVAMFKGLVVRITTKSTFYRGGKTYTKVERKDVKFVGDIGDKPVYVTTQRSTPKTDMYLLSLHADGFITIRSPEDSVYEPDPDDVDQEEAKSAWEKAIAYGKKFYQKIKESRGVKNYSDVVVPDNFTDDSLVEEEEENKVPEIQYASEAERREAQGKIVAMTPRFTAPLAREWHDGAYRFVEDQAPIVWHKIEFTPEEVEAKIDAELYYATSKADDKGFKEEEELMMFASVATRKTKVYTNCHISASERREGEVDLYGNAIFASAWYGSPKTRFVKVAQENVKYFSKTHNHIQEFFARVEKGVLTMGSALIQWNTARLIHDCLEPSEFLKNYGAFDPEMTSIRKELEQYCEDHYRSITMFEEGKMKGFKPEMIHGIVSHMDKVLALQQHVEENPEDNSGTAQLVKQLFNVDEGIVNGMAVDMDIYKKAERIRDYIKPLHTFLNEIDALTTYGGDISQDLEQEIRFYIQQKTGSIEP